MRTRDAIGVDHRRQAALVLFSAILQRNSRSKLDESGFVWANTDVSIRVVQLGERIVTGGQEPSLSRLISAVAWNAVLWSIGNLLTTGGFLLYFVKSYSPPPAALTALLVVPETFGLAGLLTSTCLSGGFSRPAIWWSGQIIARLLTLLIPATAYLCGRSQPQLAAWVIVALVAASSMLHSLSFNALVVWLAQLAPGTRWGQLFARRQLYAVLALLCVATPIAFLRDSLLRQFPNLDRLWVYTPLFASGVLLQLAALIPLLPFRHLSPPPADRPDSSPPDPDIPSARPLPSSVWRWCLANWWLAFFSGISQSPLFTLRVDLLAISLTTWYLLEATLRAAQLPLYEFAGRDSDSGRDLRSMRWGILATSLAVLVAAFATKETWALMFLTQLLFAGWAGINVAGPNVVLRLAGPDQRDAAFAWFHNVSGLAAGLAGLAGGAMVTSLAERHMSRETALRAILALSFLGRLATLLWLPRSPGAKDDSHR